MNEMVPPPVVIPPPLPPALAGSSFLRRLGTILKMGLLFVLVLLLLIPLAMVRGVLRERMARRDEAVGHITSAWGAQQLIAGPALVIPYQKRVVVTRERRLADGRVETYQAEDRGTQQAVFLPEALDIEAEIDPQSRRYGIYEAVVYEGQLKMAGRFAAPDFAALKIAEADVQWADAMVAVAVTDLRGARGTLAIKLGERSLTMEPGNPLRMGPGVSARLTDEAVARTGATFELNFNLNGSQRLRFAPFGKQTTVHVKSTWPDPSFVGAFLPVKRTVDAGGFDATWEVSYYGRAYPQQWVSADALETATIEPSNLGVDFLTVVDAYRHVERSIKYGILFVVLVFTAFFLFEVLAALRIHAFQYTMVGMALSLFYLALLSLSEFISFGGAYLAGAAASTLLITLYCGKVLGGGRRALLVGALLTVIYGFIFVILRLQDYSLLVGTAGLFLALGAVMYATRNIDWYARDGQ